MGTLLLVFFGVGSAVFGLDTVGALGVALAFGLTLLVLVYAIGPVSGCHINPAVTLGALVARRISVTDAVGYWVGQVAGGIVGAALLWGLVQWGGATDQTKAMGANAYAGTANVGGALVAEIVLTFLLVFVVLAVTGRTEHSALAGVAIGGALAAVHLAGIPLSSSGVNPARSIGPALFAGGDGLPQVWLYIVAPLVGGALAAVVLPLLEARRATRKAARR